ncbi:hypothetical protein JCM1841_001446 [Sporobolomyces salmonicolor]
MSSSTLPPPPPRRTVPALSKPPRQTSFWEKTKQTTAGAWDTAYKISDKLGHWTNKQGAKLGFEAFYPTSLDKEVTKAARILRTFTMDAADLPEETLRDRRKSQRVLRKIPPAALSSAAGIAIFTVFRAGLVTSGAGGSGVVIARLKDGSWSAPSGILLHTLGFGLLAGVDIYDVVLILRNEKAVESFSHPRISLGAEISVAAGPVGNGMQLETAVQVSPVWSYTKSKGLYGGIQLDGTILIERDDENERSYGHRLRAKEILAGAVPAPHWCTGLHQTLLAAEGADFRADLIPLGPSASESYVPANLASPLSSSFAAHKLPKAEESLDEEDVAARREMEERLRAFGIEDPDINERSRKEDPLLIVDNAEGMSTPPLNGGEGSPDSWASSSMRPFSFSSVTPEDLEGELLHPTPSLSASILSEDVEHPPTSPTEAMHQDDHDEGRKSSETVKSVPVFPPSPKVAAGEKPPVPPRRTPRVGAPASPFVGKPEEQKMDEPENQVEERETKDESSTEEETSTEEFKEAEGEPVKAEEEEEKLV